MNKYEVEIEEDWEKWVSENGLKRLYYTDFFRAGAKWQAERVSEENIKDIIIKISGVCSDEVLLDYLLCFRHRL